MTDDPEPKKSMREQVEEYKRKQRETEGKAQDFTDEDSDDSAEADALWNSQEFEGLEARVKDGLARGTNVGKIVGSIFTVVGLLLLATSGTILYFTQQSMAAEVEGLGTVIRNELRRHETSSNRSSSSRGSTDLWHAVVEFKLADGTPKTVEMSAGNWPKAFDEGEAVTVRYDPSQPLKARIAGDVGMEHLPSLITGFLGFTFFIVGASVWRFLGRA